MPSPYKHQYGVMEVEVSGLYIQNRGNEIGSKMLIWAPSYSQYPVKSIDDLTIVCAML